MRRRDMKPAPGQTVLDLFPEKRKERESPLEECVRWLTDACGCDEERIRPLATTCFEMFDAAEAFSRARELEHFYGKRATPRLQACPPSLMGMFDGGIDYHTLWDRCWAARWVPLREAMEVKCWNYTYRKHDLAPAYIWYVDVDGREVKRPYDG